MIIAEAEAPQLEAAADAAFEYCSLRPFMPTGKHGREPMLQFVESGSPKSEFVEAGSNLKT